MTSCFLFLFLTRRSLDLILVLRVLTPPTLLSHILLHPCLQLTHVQLWIFLIEHEHDAFVAKGKSRILLYIQTVVHSNIFTRQLSYLLIQRLDLLVISSPQSVSLAASSLEIRLQITKLALKLRGLGFSKGNLLRQVQDLPVCNSSIFSFKRSADSPFFFRSWLSA